ncbi:extracellular solute-binding protein [Bifidobacterium miconisargentati]|uniref:extracellular solute-binding protein n=1 Tax=Bifidobacterium miconisargentati TaxID=2834437 RepID=UPI001BDC993B|nr:extracellular solute-binding protein [Bifidobacterium miconisargentati]MBW3089852.1 extracellular solute-binding protein [Bifidobacterium miconisargentati]
MAQAKHKATIYDIAKEAGVSPSTVSRALSQPGRIAAKTEFRIRRIAGQLGYLAPGDDASDGPLPATGMIAAIVPTLTNVLYATAINAMQRRLESKGYGLITLDTDQKPAVERKAMSYVMRNVDGVALISSRLSEPDIRRITLVRPVILLNRAIPGLSSVTVDVAHAIDEAVRTLKRSGHSSITYLAGPASSWSNEYRRRCIRAAAFRYDMTYRVVRECELSVAGGGKAAEQYLIRPTDAVFAFNDSVAAGFIAAARRNGLRVPEDVSVIGFDNTEMSSLLSPALSTIDMKASQMAVRAADALVAAVRNPEGNRPEPITLTAEFVQRDSVNGHKRSTMKLGPYAEIRRSSDSIVLTMLSNAFNETMPRINEFMRTHPHIIIDPIEGRTQENTLSLYWERVINHRSVPDIINVERTALPQLAASGALQDLSGPDIERELGSKVDRAAWQSAHYAGRLYGIPGDQSQTAMFYRADLFRHYELEVPQTWDEFYEEGVALHARNPQRYMGVLDTTDVQHYLSFFRSACVRPWTVEDDSTITFHMRDDLVRSVAEFIQQCIDDGALRAEPMWDNRYMRAESGTYLTVTYANWLGKILAASYPADKGLWKVTLPPAFSDPSRVSTAEIGGSTLAVSAGLPPVRLQAAMTFLRWFQLDPVSVELRAPGGVSAAAGYVEDLTRRGTVDPYFDQPIYDVYAKSAALVNRDWDNLPFFSQLDAEFARLIVPALRPGGRSADLFDEWERRLKIYAVSQGFTVR